MSTFCDAFTCLRQSLDQCRQDRLQMIARVRGEVRTQAEHTTSTLAEQDHRRHAEFNTFMDGLRQEIHSQADQTRTRLADLTADLRRAGAAFQRS